MSTATCPVAGEDYDRQRRIWRSDFYIQAAKCGLSLEHAVLLGGIGSKRRSTQRFRDETPYERDLRFAANYIRHCVLDYDDVLELMGAVAGVPTWFALDVWDDAFDAMVSVWPELALVRGRMTASKASRQRKALAARSAA